MLSKEDFEKLQIEKNNTSDIAIKSVIDDICKHGHMWLGRTHEEGLIFEKEMKDILDRNDIKFSIRGIKLTIQ